MPEGQNAEEEEGREGEEEEETEEGEEAEGGGKVQDKGRSERAMERSGPASVASRAGTPSEPPPEEIVFLDENQREAVRAVLLPSKEQVRAPAACALVRSPARKRKKA